VPPHLELGVRADPPDADRVRDVILRMTTTKVSGGRRSMASAPGVLRTPSRVADSGSELESWTLSMGSEGAQQCGGRRSNKCLLLSRYAFRVARFALGPHLGRAAETRAVRARDNGEPVRLRNLCLEGDVVRCMT